MRKASFCKEKSAHNSPIIDYRLLQNPIAESADENRLCSRLRGGTVTRSSAQRAEGSGLHGGVEDCGVSGVTRRRPGLDAALAKLGHGDALVVWKLDRLGRSLLHLIETVKELGEREVGFASLSESIDTSTAGGTLIFHMMAALAEFEHSLIVERVNAGIAAARKRGKHIGRPRKLTAEQIAHAKEAIEGGLQTPASMAGLLGVDHSTLWRSMQRFEGVTHGR